MLRAMPPADQRRAIFAAFPIAAVVLALRWTWFGDPIAGLDEQFYLLAGDRLTHGALPYVEIWDRKPAGLFLLYAAIRLLPGDGILAYQLVASLCLIATGWMTALIARRFAPFGAAVASGCAVAAYGVLLGMGFGEAPAFHDLLTVTAVWLLLPVVNGRDSVARALLAMLLCGVAITIKTNAALEGAAIGLVLAAVEWRCASTRARWLARVSAYALAGLLPTLAIAGFYLAVGAFNRFWFATFVSILRKSGGSSPDSVAGLVACLVLLAPLIGLAILGTRRINAPVRILLLGWTAGCVASFAAIGFFAFHYALPLATPLALLAAPALGRWGGRIAIALIGAAAAITSFTTAPSTDRQDVAALARLLPPAVRTGCLFVYEGPTILYHLAGACLPGRYVFPGHFTDPQEAGALERPSSEILRETLARRPTAIITVAGRDTTANDRLVRAALASGYRLAGTQRIRLYGGQRETAEVWQRR